jgi:hypothetical protein
MAKIAMIRHQGLVLVLLDHAGDPHVRTEQDNNRISSARDLSLYTTLCNGYSIVNTGMKIQHRDRVAADRPVYAPR